MRLVKRALKLLVPIVALTMIGTMIAGAQARGAVIRHNIYSVKFVCGEFGKSLNPNPPSVEGPVAPGYYATVINVHNPAEMTPVTFTKKAVVLFIGSGPTPEQNFEQPHQPANPRIKAQLGPDFALMIDCQDIRTVLAPPPPPPGAPPPLIEGFVVIIVDGPATGAAPPPLDVTAVYTGNGYNCKMGCASVVRNGFSQDVLVITPTTVTT